MASSRTSTNNKKSANNTKSTNTSRKTTVSKRQKGSNTRGTNKKNQIPEESKSFLRDEITILLTLTGCALLMISNFGFGGFLGNLVSRICFGMFGILAYIIPILIFAGMLFFKSNKGNPLAYIKEGAGVVCCLMFCILCEMFTNGYESGKGLFKYFFSSYDGKNGGGLVGGLFVNVLCPAIGVVGTCLAIVVVYIICFVIITEKSFISSVKKRSKRVYMNAKEDAIRRREKLELQKLELANMKLQSGVTFDTTVAKSLPKKQEAQIIKPEEVLMVKEESSGQLVINRAQPLEEDRSEEYKEKIPTRQKTKESRKQVEKETANIEHQLKQEEEKPKKAYQFPPINLLKKGKITGGDSDEYLRQTALKLEQTLRNFNVNVAVTNISCGPTVTRYELQPEMGVKVSKIVNLADDIKLNLAASDIRIEAPIPGKAAVGIEVPNKENAAVMLRDLLESEEFRNHKSKISFAAGRDISGQVVVADIAKMPHVLIAGATGSGKSVCINTLIMSILYKAHPDDVKLIMVDPKVVELSVYNGIPHLMIPVVTDPKKAAGALNWAVTEMARRYQLFAEYNVRDLQGYNVKVESVLALEGLDLEDENKLQKLPQIVIIVDELADLMMVAPGEVEDAICRLAQLARAAGIHLVLATQRPSVNVITGLIKANMPSRIAFAVSSGVDSRTIIDMNGAEKLLGKGDMLFYPSGYSKPARVQGSFVSDKEVQAVVEFLVNNTEKVSYNEEIANHVNNSTENKNVNSVVADEKDVYFVDAGKFVIEKDKASIGMLQRVFKVGFNRAARIMDQLQEAGVVGPEEGTKPRKILMSMEQFEQYIEECL